MAQECTSYTDNGGNSQSVAAMAPTHMERPPTTDSWLRLSAMACAQGRIGLFQHASFLKKVVASPQTTELLPTGVVGTLF